MRALAAIAHHGSKNRRHLERMLAALRAMDLDVTIVILAEAPKRIADDVEVRVGLPTSDPWSLPFAHRPLFRDRRNDFDLFIYSEDDTLIEQRHVDAFLRLSKIVPEDCIPGFIRYEKWPDGRRSISTVHGYYRWDPSSVFVKGDRTFARFTNDHSACYMLTKSQLGHVLDSGGYAMEPHQGAYDMLVSAATDPYTRCGLTKIVCLEEIDDLLIHHLPNAYLGKLGISDDEFRVQADAVLRLGRGAIDSMQLLEPQLPPRVISWSKHTYPRTPSPVLESLPFRPRRVLSLGCVSGLTEGALAAEGIAVTAVPVDAIMGRLAASRGVDVLPARIPAGNEILGLGPFDAILAVDVLGYLESPIEVLRAVRPALSPNGVLAATVPDHWRYAMRNRFTPRTGRVLPVSWAQDGIHRTDSRTLRQWIESAGYQITSMKRRRATRREPLGSADIIGRLAGNTLLAVATHA